MRPTHGSIFAGLGALACRDLPPPSPWWMRGSPSPEQDFLPPDVAFHVTTQLEGDVLQIRWVIADGYFLYRSKIRSALRVRI
jgi:thiol:disulfide interchange protein